MKQKTGKLTVITVLLLTVCIAAGAMGLPRLLGESFSIPEAAEPALSGTALWVGMDELPLELHDTACSVYSVTGRYTPQEAVIRAIVDELDSAYAHWVVNSHWALDDYRAACASLGHRVQRGSVCGEAVAIADDFSLLIRTDAGEFIPVSSGEILYA